MRPVIGHVRVRVIGYQVTREETSIEPIIPRTPVLGVAQITVPRAKRPGQVGQSGPESVEYLSLGQATLQQKGESNYCMSRLKPGQNGRTLAEHTKPFPPEPELSAVSELSMITNVAGPSENFAVL